MEKADGQSAKGTQSRRPYASLSCALQTWTTVSVTCRLFGQETRTGLVLVSSFISAFQTVLINENLCKYYDNKVWLQSLLQLIKMPWNFSCFKQGWIFLKLLSIEKFDTEGIAQKINSKSMELIGS